MEGKSVVDDVVADHRVAVITQYLGDGAATCGWFPDAMWNLPLDAK